VGCFVEPAFDTYGNAGVGYLDTDGTKDVDFSVVRNFVIHENLRLQFRAEAFNLLNSVNFGQPGAGFAAGSGAAGQVSSVYGVVSSAGAPREIQFALKLMW
jgi:hypothetical protein